MPGLFFDPPPPGEPEDLEALLDRLTETHPRLAQRIEDILDWLETEPRDNTVRYTQFTIGHRRNTVHGDGEDWQIIWDETPGAVYVAAILRVT